MALSLFSKVVEPRKLNYWLKKASQLFLEDPGMGIT